MFGIEKDELVANLEILRQRLCCYMGPTCDCKFGVGERENCNSEQTGCPEIRQAIEYINERWDAVLRQTDIFEDNARKRLARVREIVNTPD